MVAIALLTGFFAGNFYSTIMRDSGNKEAIIKPKVVFTKTTWQKISKDVRVKTPIKTVQHGYRVAWVKYKTVKKHDITGHEIVDCSKGRVLEDSFTSYNGNELVNKWSDGATILSDINNDINWELITPDTEQEEYTNYICTH